MTAVVGIDPGGQSTGLVVRHRDTLVAHTTVLRNKRPMGWYLAEILDTASEYVSLAANAAVEAGDWLVAVEGINDPNPHVRLTNVRGLIDTATVLGAVLGRWPAVIVPPGGNGSGPLGAYPEALRPTRGQGRGRDALRHERSGWDVAGAALTVQRLEAAR